MPVYQGTRPVVGDAADNTALNERDQKPGAATADRQSNSEHDIELIRRIRQAIVNDDELSTYARNVKVIAQDGDIVLKGPVRSPEERDRVQELAARAAGQAPVRDEMSLTTTGDRGTAGR